MSDVGVAQAMHTMQHKKFQLCNSSFRFANKPVRQCRLKRDLFQNWKNIRCLFQTPCPWLLCGDVILLNFAQFCSILLNFAHFRSTVQSHSHSQGKLLHMKDEPCILVGLRGDVKKTVFLLLF